MGVLALVGAYLFLLLCVIVTGYMVSLLFRWYKNGKIGKPKIKLESTAGMTKKERKEYNKKINAQIKGITQKQREFIFSGLRKKKNNEDEGGEKESEGNEKVGE